ncbi:MAG: (deoxy)nucleoside triphosphate pyrophosphohydrolase [Pseudomonadota bacterium]|nr:(deoxy)nucleoside triphosphate pyrophosphohydrolase [Pseudomonadota bacterium]
MPWKNFAVMPSGLLQTPELNVAVGVFQNSLGEVLISQRSKEVFSPGAWEFPGGKLTKFETPLQALKRELYEELGVSVLYVRYLSDTRYDYGNFRVRLFSWRVLHWDGSVRPLENQVLKWIPLKKLKDQGLLEADISIINILNRKKVLNIDIYPKLRNFLKLNDLVEKLGSTNS